MSPHHTAIMAKVHYVLDNRQGMTAIFGEVGTGKTSFARTLLDVLSEAYETIYLYNPDFKDCRSTTPLLKTICSEFNLPMRRSHQLQMEELQKFLLDVHQEGRSAVIIADEAQLLTPKALEFFRQLSNFETNEAKLSQVILIGQTELKLKLKKKKALWSRIIMASTLEALSFDDMVEMLSFRLVDVAKGDPGIFTPSSLERIYFHSKGIPREAIKVSAQSMAVAHMNQIKPITPEVVDIAHEGAEK
jgi:general secretion pathway protein A